MSKAQIRNLQQLANSATVVEQEVIHTQSEASSIIVPFEDAPSIYIPHPGSSRFVEVTIYSTDYHKFPEMRIDNIFFGVKDELNSSNYITITFHQSESGVVRITL
jgi:hypothetical protein